MTEPVECCRCHCAPEFITTSGLWYVYCPKCTRKSVHSICGLTKEKAIIQWNDINRHRGLFQTYEPDATAPKKKRAPKPKPTEEELRTMGSRIQYVGKRYIGIEKLKGGRL